MRVLLLRKYFTHQEEQQKNILFSLLYKASFTVFGKYHDFLHIETYEDFAKYVPPASYKTLSSLIKRVYQGEKNVLRPGSVRLFTESAGTTGESKILPITKEALRSNHFATGQDVLAFFVEQYPEINLFRGKSLSLGGNYRKHPTRKSVFVGNISAFLSKYMPVMFTSFRYPSTRIAQIENRDEKLQLLVKDSVKKDIRVIAGIPAWIDMYITAMENTYKKSFMDIFPNLSLILYGGSSLDNYRDRFQKKMGGLVKFLSMYNASEGFFAFQDNEDKDMLLVTWRNVFYEFEERNTGKILPLWKVDLKKEYEILITTSSGLWRRRLGDVVRFTSLHPYRIQIIGRIKLQLSKFREDIYVYQVDEVIQKIKEKYHYNIGEYSVGYDVKGERHVWWIELSHDVDTALLAHQLDDILQNIQRDYREVRQGGGLTIPHVKIFPLGYFLQQMKKQGKMGGQQKIKRIRM